MKRFPEITSWILLLALVSISSGCGRLWMPSEKIVYERACEAIERSSDFPIGTKLHSIDKARIYIGKSAGRIDIPCDLASVAGVSENPTYVVLMKRVARTWVVETIHPPGKYPEPFQAEKG